MSYALLILLVSITFANSFKNSFIAGDDYNFIVRNPKIAVSLTEIPSVFTRSLTELTTLSVRCRYYRPVLFLFNIGTYRIWGIEPAGFHLTNVLLHLLSVLILYKTGRILFENDRLLALIGASIFAVHPVHNQTVAGAGLGDAIYGFFLILCLYLYLREKRLLSLAAFSLALLSKEASVVFPLALMVLAAGRKGLKKGLMEITPYFMLTALYLWVREMVVAGVSDSVTRQPAVTQLLTMSVAAFDYIRLLAVPYPLSPFYPAHWYSSALDLKVIIALSVLSALCFVVFKAGKDKVMLFLLFAPLVMLAPVILRVNAFPMGLDRAYIAERFLYVPAMFFSLLVAYAFHFFKGRSRQYLMVGWLLAIIALSVMSVVANRVWKDSFSLYGRILEEYPEAAFAHYNLGVAFEEQGFYDEALREYAEAIRLRPDHPEAHYKLGFVYFFIREQTDLAARHFEAAAALDPDNAKTHLNLAISYRKMGLAQKAEEQSLIAKRLNPDLYGDK
ncbi:MAG: tetratricopeptide repeat protein [Nitrospirae bacterium]|nr:tetratricopeptide repeat protein [Nitrospirota bacterium]